MPSRNDRMWEVNPPNDRSGDSDHDDRAPLVVIAGLLVIIVVLAVTVVIAWL